jgi:hypothetical protein
MIMVSQRLLKPSNGLVKGSFVPGLDLRQLQIRPHGESVSRPYTLLDIFSSPERRKFTLPGPELIVNVIGF